MLCQGFKATSGWELPVLQQLGVGEQEQRRPFSLVTLTYVTAKQQEEKKSLPCATSLKVKKGATHAQVPVNGILSCKAQQQVSFPSMMFSTHPSEQFLVCGKAIV